MIKLTRERTAGAIPPALRGKGRVKLKLLLLRGKRDNTLKFSSSVWTKAKQQLKKESSGKCAYCEASTETVAHGDVEHFRPKSIYWWLAYCYDNYLFSCQICNQSFKGDSFPLYGTALQCDPPLPDPLPDDANEEQLRAIARMLTPDPLDDADGYPMERFAQAVLREKPGLIDPYTVDPEPFFTWVADAVLKEVYIRPRNNRTTTKRVFAAVEQFLGLNRVELLRWRWKTYEYLEVLKDALVSNQLSDELQARMRDQIKAMMSNRAQFAGMVRYFVQQEWRLRLD